MSRLQFIILIFVLLIFLVITLLLLNAIGAITFGPCPCETSYLLQTLARFGQKG